MLRYKVSPETCLSLALDKASNIKNRPIELEAWRLPIRQLFSSTNNSSQLKIHNLALREEVLSLYRERMS
jgi:hypothetical protein